MGVDESTVGRWRSGIEPRGGQIGKLADALGVPEGELYVGGEERPATALELQALLHQLDQQQQNALLAVARSMAGKKTPSEPPTTSPGAPLSGAPPGASAGPAAKPPKKRRR